MNTQINSPNISPPHTDETDFGFKMVQKSEKPSLVKAVFDNVARHYDLMNDLMSLGIHRIWKKMFITELAPRPHLRLLDLAGGTGDITFGWLNAGGGDVILSDINATMLTEGRRRAVQNGLIGKLWCVVVNGEQIALPDESVDRVTISFGLRNCTNKNAVLHEANRVLKPGGRFLCLEFSRLQIGPLTDLYNAWCFRTLPRIGAVIAKDWNSYQYLAESIRTFPSQETLADMMNAAGFSRIRFTNLSGGIVAIHSGWRI